MLLNKRTKDSNTLCSSVNVLDIFNSVLRRGGGRGHLKYTLHDVSLNDLLPFIQKPLSIHYIRPKLFSLPHSKLHSLYNSSFNPV